MASNSIPIVMHTKPVHVFFTEPQDGEMIIRLAHGVLEGPMILHVSSAKVGEHFKGLEIDDIYTEARPFFMHSHHGAALITLMKLAHNKEVAYDEVSEEDFRWMAELALEHNYQGRAPPWLADRLCGWLPADAAMFPEFERTAMLEKLKLKEFDTRRHGEAGESLMVASLFQGLCLSYAFDLPGLFARCSRQLTWILCPLDCRATGAGSNKDKLITWIYNAHVALRGTLYAKLPPVLYPDPHGEDDYCQKCNAVPHLRRWLRELWNNDKYWVDAISKDGMYDPSCVSLYTTFYRMFNTLLEDFPSDHKKDINQTGPLPCGRFRVCVDQLPAFSDASLLEIVYEAIGGWCLECFRSGSCHFKLKCTEHKVMNLAGVNDDSDEESEDGEVASDSLPSASMAKRGHESRLPIRQR